VVGNNVTFSVTATGTGLSYQWLFGGSVIGTSSSLTLNNVTTSQVGIYTVIVNGACGSVTSSATLTVNVPVTVTVAPVSQTTVVGSNVTFSVTATGTGLSYQWLFGGSVIGTSSSLTLNNVTTSQTGTYTVIVSGACGSVTNSATLTVNFPVAIKLTIAPQGAGNVAVTASGGSPSQTYVFQFSTNMANWITISTNTADSNGAATIIDVAPKQFHNRFYRIVASDEKSTVDSHQTTTNTNWTTIRTNAADSNGLAAMIDADAKKVSETFLSSHNAVIATKTLNWPI
jgi:hypothetical protein